MSQLGEPGAVPPPPNQEPDGEAEDHGGPWKRLFARIIDGVLVTVPVTIILVLLQIGIGSPLAGLLQTAALFAYFVYLETSRGATFGKQLLGLRVTDEVGTSPISSQASMRRNWWVLFGVVGGVPVLGPLASLVGLVIYIAIGVTISSHPRRQGFHDRMAGTLVPERR